MHMERCANCGKPHETQRPPAVYIKGRYFCRPNCHNTYKEKPREIDCASDTVHPRSLRRDL